MHGAINTFMAGIHRRKVRTVRPPSGAGSPRRGPLSAVGAAELRRGALNLPAGRRRDRLIAEINALVPEGFGQRVLPFDSAAAQELSAIFADRRATDRAISLPDWKIAAISRSHVTAVATRNGKDFEGCGIKIVEPWISR